MTKSRTWTLGAAVVVLAVMALGWFLLISPKRSNAAALTTTAADTAAQNLSTEASIRQLKLEQKQLPAQEAQIAAIRQQMPNEPLLPALIRQLTNAAGDSNVNLTAIAPAAIAPVPADPGVSYIATDVTAVGDFTQLKQFLFALEENKRAVLVTGVSIGKAEGVPDPTALQMVVKTRVFISGVAATAPVSSPAATGAASTTGTGSATGSVAGSATGAANRTAANANAQTNSNPATAPSPAAPAK